MEAHRALAGWTRVALLTRLQASNRPLDARELAEATGLHVNTVRFHLDVLAKTGLVSTGFEHRPRRGRPRRVWHADAAVESGPEVGYRMLAEVLAGYLQTSVQDPDQLGLAIGTTWGSELAGPANEGQLGGLDRVVRMLSELGFSPEAVEGPHETRLLLHSCPFLEVAKRNRQLICSAHLGLLRGALAEAEVPLLAAGLDPLVEPSLCIAHLQPQGQVPAEVPG